MHTRNPETKNHPNMAWLAYNMKITGQTVEPIKGFKQFANQIATANQKIRDSYTFILKDGTELPVRVRDDGTNNIVEYYSATGNTWYEIFKMTKGLNTSFTDYNTTTVNQLFFGNGTDNYSKWSGLRTGLTSAVTATDTDINVTSTTGFPASGDIYYNGTKIAYTSKTATTFVVGSAHASAGADDSVTEAVVEDAGVAYSDIMISAQNRVWLTGDLTSLEYSKEGDATNWAATSTREGAGIEDFPIVGGRITGLAAKDEYVIIFKERTVILFKWNYPSDVLKTPDFKHVAVGDNLGAINHKSIANSYKEVFYLSKNGLKSLTKQLQTGDWEPQPITDIISPNLKNYDYSDGVSFYDSNEDVLLVACKSDSNYDNNDKVIAVWFYKNENGEERIGISILDISANSFFKYNNKLYYCSSMEGNCYELFTGYTRNGAAIQSYYTDNRNDFGKKSIKTADLYVIEGLIKSGTTIDIKIIFDGGLNGSQKVTIKDTDEDVVAEEALNTMGSYTIGEEVLGGIYDEATTYKPFRKIIELQNKSFFDLQLERKCESKGGHYKIYYEGLVDPSEDVELSAN